MLIEVVVSGLLAATTAISPSRPATVSWDEAREAIAACVCVESITHEAKEYFLPRAGSCEACRPAAPETTLSWAVARAYEAAVPVLISLKPPGLGEASRPGPGLALDERTLLAREAYLGHEPFLRLILGRLRAALAEAGTACSDCPEFAPRPPRHVAWSEYLPYLTAHVWPDPVVTPTGADESPAGERGHTFHICAGINGVAEMHDPDPHLVQAGFLGAFHTKEIGQMASAHLKTIIKEEPFIDLGDDDARTRYLRRRLSAEMARDAAVKVAVCRTLRGFAADIDLAVDGCEET